MIPDMKIDNLMCTKRSFVEGRELEDNAFVIMNLKGSENVQAGAQIYCWASSINSGARHYHKIRVVGSKASLEWDDERRTRCCTRSRVSRPACSSAVRAT